jgi:hypothetical protein
MNTKHLLMISFFMSFMTLCKAQVVDDIAGKTYYYYDAGSNKKVKEVYHHKQMIAILPDPANYGSYTDSIYYIKSGPYTRYHENGSLECSGYFKNEKKDSTWKYYDPKGKLIKQEEYLNGQLVQK